MLKIITASILTVISVSSIAETKESERLLSIAKDYAKCADVALGNFPSDEESQKAVKIFYSQMIDIIRKVVDAEEKSSDERVSFSIDLMGKEILIGFMLKSVTEVDPAYQKAKKDLKKSYEWEWRPVHKELWSKHGCNAIFNSIKN